MTDNTEALPPLPEDSRERENFDSTTTELYGGDALAQVQRTLTIFSRQAPPSGSYAKILAIFANEVGKARAALAQRQQPASEAMPCGHHSSLLLKSAETGEPLYCELCDAQSGRRDAQQRESELAEANESLRAALAQRQQVPEARMRETLEFIAQHFSSDWPERCQSHVLAARHCLTAAPSAQAEPSQRQGCATTSESAEPKAKAEHTAEDRADNPERARRSASLGGAALAQAESQVPQDIAAIRAACRAEALEEAAQRCEQIGVALCDTYGDGAECIRTGEECAAAIREMK